jgi:hypothetical protein
VGQQPAVELQPVPSSALTQALEEFRTQTSRLGGRGGTGVQTSAPKPKAVWHGRIYENIRNNAFDAIPHQIVQRGGQQRKLRRNQYGFSVSGPVVAPKVYNGAGKTFFTLTYEGMRESIGQFNLNTIPTMLERTGQYGHVVDPNGQPLKIYDPLTTSTNPLYDSRQAVSASNLQYLRQQFVNNVIPLTRLDPVALNTLQYLPAPNTNAGPFFQNNYYSVTPEVNSANGFILSVDHSFLKKNRLTVRINKSDGLNGNAAVFLTPANSFNPSQLQESRGLRIEHVFTASPTNVNTLRLDLSSNRNRNQPQGLVDGKPLPRYQFDNVYLPMGQNNPISRDAFNNYTLSNTFASRWRKHRLSLQIELTQQLITTYRPQSPEGRFDFTAGYTSLPGIINTGHPFASFLLGGAAQAAQSIVMTIGANLETFTQRKEKYDRQSTVDLNVTNPANGRPGALVVVGTYGYGRTFLPAWTRVEPSLSLAWSVLGNNNTVLRLSLDRRYAQPNSFNGHWATQAFNGTPVYLSPNQQLQPAVFLRNGLQNFPFPDTRLEAANGTVAALVDPYKFQPTSMNFTVALQRQIAKNLIATVNFNRQYGRNQFTGSNLVNPNAIPLDALQYRDKLNDLNFANSLRPYPQYQDFDAQNVALGRFINHNFSIQIEKRTSGGLAVTGGYNHFMRWDDMSSPAQNLYDRKSAWSIAQFSQPHSFNFNVLYELPFGPGKRFFASGPLGKHILGGWALSDTSSYYGGQPLRLQPAFNNTGGVIPFTRLYIDEVPGVDPRVANPSPNQWFNAAAFVNPPDFTPGNGPRVHPFLRSPGGYNHDMTLNKRMAAGADRTLEFTASLFNATNHANWNYPDVRIGTLKNPNYNAGRIIGSTGGRIVQLGLRLNF